MPLELTLLESPVCTHARHVCEVPVGLLEISTSFANCAYFAPILDKLCLRRRRQAREDEYKQENSSPAEEESKNELPITSLG